MRTVRLSYPHSAMTLEPGRLRAGEIWNVAYAARRQICMHPRRPKVEVSSIIAGTRRLVINNHRLETHWDCAEAVRDDHGLPAYGSTEYDPAVPGVARVRLHGPALGDAGDVLRSTALHELGHVVFDVPSWTRATASAADPSIVREFQKRDPTRSRTDPGLDWSEWRANEFMGAFLAPRDLLHSWAVKRASCLGFALLNSSGALPVVCLGPGGDIDDLLLHLAEMFGLSPSFIAFRLRRYGIMRTQRLAIATSPGLSGIGIPSAELA